MTIDTDRRVRPTIAAVIVNYNYARYLPEAIESVLRQRTPFDDVIVVNDGSTDDSMTVLAGYSEAVRVLDIPNGGQLGACLAGLAATTADYVYFLDADDYTHPELVETVAGRLSRSPVKVQFQLEGVNPDTPALESIFPSFPVHYDAARMRDDNRSIGFYICPPTSGNVYRRQTLQALPLDKLDQRDFIDGPVTLALPYVGDIESITGPLACYRLHGNNHSQWSEPTSELLSHEMEWFSRRWVETAQLVDMAAAPFGSSQPLYVVERELMIAALEHQARAALIATRFLRTLLPTNLPPRQKLMLTVWAVGLSIPVTRLRSMLVRARRSPLNRSSRVRKLVGVLLRGRRR